MTAAAASVAGALGQIGLRFLAKLQDQCLVLDRLLAAGQAADAETATEAVFVLHKIAGVAGTLGYPRLGQSARGCEQRLASDLSAGGRPTPDSLRAIAAFRQEAAQLLAG